MTLSQILLPTSIQMLEAFAGMLKKAANHDESETAMMALRLAPDMHALTSQIAFTCVQPQQALARLTGGTQPDMPTVTSFAEAQALIAATIAQLKAADPAAIDAAAAQSITMNLPNGMTFVLDGAEYVRDWTLPQFYFHLTTAYALLRQAGVSLGKADLVPHMARYAPRAG